MAVVDDKDQKKKVVKKRKTRPKNRKRGDKKTNYNCPICKDSGTVYNEQKKAIKCSCLIESELRGWFDPRIKQALRGAGLKISVQEGDDLEGADLLFNGVNSRMFLKYVGKHLMTKYFRNNMNTFDYKVMTGNDYTEKYVVGEHIVYHNVSELFVILGFDNFNKTLGTTMYSLLNERQLKGLTTWLFVPDTSKTTASIMDLYGEQVLEYVKDHDNFYKVIGKKK